MKKINFMVFCSALIMLVCLTFSLNVQSVDAAVKESKYTGTGFINTTAKQINMYKTASTTAAKVTSIPKTEKVTVSAKTNNNFYKVTFNGKSGYIATGYLVLDSAVKKYNGIGVTTASTKSYVSANINSKSTATFKKSVKLPVTGIVGTWYQIKNGKNYEYVENKTLKVTGTETISKLNFPAKFQSTVTVLSEANAQANSKGTFNSGNKITITGKSNSFYQITYNGNVGYVPIKSILIEADFSTLNSQGTGKQAITIYSLPDKLSTKVKSVSKGTSFIIKRGNKNWYYIQTGSNGSVAGYVPASQIDVHDTFKEGSEKQYIVENKVLKIYNAPSTSASYKTVFGINLKGIDYISSDKKWVSYVSTHDNKKYYIKLSDVNLKTMKGKNKDEKCKYIGMQCTYYLDNYETDNTKQYMEIVIIEAIVGKSLDKVTEKVYLDALKKARDINLPKMYARLAWKDVKKVFGYVGHAMIIYEAAKDYEEYASGFESYVSAPLYLSILKNDKGKGTIITFTAGFFSAKSQ